MSKNKKTNFLAATTLLLALTGCGSGGDDGSPPPASPPPPTPPPPPSITMSGTAATGAPLAGGTLRVIDRAGVTRSLSAPIGADGRYTIDVTGMSAPLLLVAEGRVGESTAQMYAIEPTGSSSSPFTVNVTPLTTAVAALVAQNNNPAGLTQPSALAAVTGAQVSQVVGALNTALAPLYAAAGITNASSFSPMSTPFAVSQPGQDRLLDAVKINVGTQGVTFTNATAPISGDTPDAGTVITLNGANLANPPTIVASVNSIAVDFLAGLQQGFNDCFALATAVRATSSACTGLFDASYLQHGYTAAQRWTGAIPALDGARFAIPELLYTALDNSGNPLPVIRLVWTQSDGAVRTRADVLRNFGTATAPAWKLRGNLRPIELFVEPRFQRTLHQNPNAGVSRYELGLRLIVNLNGPNGDTIARALVKGPGLPVNGVLMVRSSSCGTGDRLIIQNDTGALTDGLGQQLVWTTNSAFNFRVAYADYESTRPFSWPGTSRNYRDTPLSAAEVEAIRLGSRYTFDIWYRDPVSKIMNVNPVQYSMRIGSVLPAADSGAREVWNTVADATLNSVLAANAVPANAATVSFTRATGAEAVSSLYLYGEKLDPQFNPPLYTSGPLLGALLRVIAIEDVGITATSANLAVAAESRGLDFNIGTILPACSAINVPGLAEMSAYREIGLVSLMATGVRKYSVYAYQN